MDEGQKPKNVPKQDFRDPAVRKNVAEMLLRGATQDEVAKHLGYARKSSLSFFLKRAGGTDAVIREAYGEDAVRRYREFAAEAKRAGVGQRIRHAEGGLDEDVQRDPSQGLQPAVFEGLGTQEEDASRKPIARTSEIKETEVPGALKAKIQREIRRAEKITDLKGEVQQMVQSVVGALLGGGYPPKNLPVTILYATSSTATGGSIEEATAADRMRGKNIILRVILPRVPSETGTGYQDMRRAREKAAAFAGALREAITNAKDPASALGSVIRKMKTRVKIQLQIMHGPIPMVLASNELDTSE